MTASQRPLQKQESSHLNRNMRLRGGMVLREHSEPIHSHLYDYVLNRVKGNLSHGHHKQTDLIDFNQLKLIKWTLMHNNCITSSIIYLRSKGDSLGHLPFGVGVSARSGVVIQELSLSLRLSPLTRVSVVAEVSWVDFTVSPEKVAIHASTDSERKSNTKYFALRKILHTGKQKPIAVWLCWCETLRVATVEAVNWSLGYLILEGHFRFHDQSSHGDGTCCHSGHDHGEERKTYRGKSIAGPLKSSLRR